MAKKTINQALKDLFLGLGGDSSALEDNSSVSDYIADLESAIKACASGSSEDLIDDTDASETKTYSSSKIETLTDLIDDTEASETKTYSSSKIENLTGSTYSETVIFNGHLEKTGTNTGTLDEAITGFDAIILITNNTDPDSADDYLTPSPYIPVSNLVGIPYKLEYGVNISNEPICNFTITNSTTIVWRAVTPLKKVIGVKF